MTGRHDKRPLDTPKCRVAFAVADTLTAANPDGQPSRREQQQTA
jgi:hypothetical protein